MNLDILSYIHAIKTAANSVQNAAIGGNWMLLGYTEGDEGAKKLKLMTIDVIKEGSIWKDLLTSFEDDKIMYGYVKLDYAGNIKLFLIHWVGKNVSENEKSSCMPHLNEVRNLLPYYDHLINSMEALDIQCKVQDYLTRAMSIDVSRPHSKSEAPEYINWSSQFQSRFRANTSDFEKRDTGSFIRTYTVCDALDTITENKNKNNIDSTEESLRNTNSSRTQQATKPPKFKVAIIGSIGVGKTSIYLSYSEGGSALTSPHLIMSTTHADYMSKRVTVEQHLFTLEIWDTAGQERFMAFASAWTRNAKVVIISYDITDEDSFKEVPTWLGRAQEFADTRAIYVLVGNKADLVGRRAVMEDTAKEFATRHGMIFMECSGLTGYNILKLFEHISRMIVIVYSDLLSTSIARECSESTIHLHTVKGSNTHSVSSTAHKRPMCSQCK